MNQSRTWQIILKQIGSFLILLSIVMVAPSIFALFYHELYSLIGFLISAIITAAIGFSLYYGFHKTDEPVYNQALLIAAYGYAAIAFFGGFPFFIIAMLTPEAVMANLIPAGATYTESSLVYFREPIHCLFESMSAFTTTGLTMAVHEPSIGKALLFYRSLSQWVGGAGFIIMVLALFRHTPARSAILLYTSESTGERLKPKVVETTRAIWKVYLILTLFSALYLTIGTIIILPQYPVKEILFDAINHAMAGQSTGGFSTLDDSIAGYQSVYMEMLYLLPMILGSFSIPFYYRIIFEAKYREIWRDIQTRNLIIAFILGAGIQSYLLLNAGTISSPVREGVFQFISAMTTTGWQTSNIASWDWLSHIFIIFAAMIIGGASGATVGGIKIIRALIIKKGLQWQITKTFLSDHTIKNIRFNARMMLPNEMNEEFTKASSLAIMFIVTILFCAIASQLILGNQISFTESLFESASAQATVGLSVGITDPSMPKSLETIYIIQMWIGRLEVIPVFALIRAIFWGTKPR